MIALVGCVKSKLTIPSPAKKIYISPLFKKAVSYIKKRGYDNWFILSAKYGLLDKNKIIEPYELTLSSFSKDELKHWSDKVGDDIKKYRLNDLHFYCGSNYHNDFLLNFLKSNNIKYELPLLGLSLGQRLAFFNNENRVRTKGFF
ncbi:MAG: hypothetical protein M0R03_22700 [Novosphingobium sp.]|jgi:hypothetical protein|nr:hypothetical protein [Novosphingobium sp.]